MKKGTSIMATTALAVALGLSACSTTKHVGKNDNAPAASKGIELSATQQNAVESNNRFAFRLYKELKTDESYVLSPLSVVYLMGMLNNGAAGQTREEINNTLGFDNTGADGINALCNRLLTKMGSLDDNTTIHIANCIDVNKNYALKKEFKNTVQKQYLASVESLDFSNASTLGKINGWCAQHTDGMIPKMIDEVDPSAVAYAMNAIFFKGKWKTPFDKELTQKADFTLANGNKKSVDMMAIEDRFLYAANDTYAALQLPYGNGSFAMTVVLPNEGKSIDNAVAAISSASWQATMQTLVRQKVNVKLPRFETETSTPLNAPLSALGAPSMFNAQTAQFPYLCNAPVYISKMFQKAKIEVNEEGTKAAAVTMGIVSLTSVALPKPVPQFHADRPFLYLITEQSTGTILFMGQYTGK